MKKLFKGHIDRHLVLGVSAFTVLYGFVNVILWRLMVLAGEFTVGSLVAINVMMLIGLFILIMLDHD